MSREELRESVICHGGLEQLMGLIGAAIATRMKSRMTSRVVKKVEVRVAGRVQVTTIINAKIYAERGMRKQFGAAADTQIH